MKKEFSDNQLILISLIVIALSIFTILLSTGKLGITGASTEQGYVNVTVPTSAAITLHTVSINFSTTLPGVAKNSYASADVSTREYGGTHMPCDVDNHCGINITNDGSVFINITIQATEALFTSGSYDADTHFLYNVTMQDLDYSGNGNGPNVYAGRDNCSVGYDGGLSGVGGVGHWRGVPTSTEVAICYLNYTDTLGACTKTGEERTGNSDICPDIARVEFNITVPGDEGGGDKAGTIQFVASDATPA